jgi:phage gp36-like protein
MVRPRLRFMFKAAPENVRSLVEKYPLFRLLTIRIRCSYIAFYFLTSAKVMSDEQ